MLATCSGKDHTRHILVDGHLHGILHGSGTGRMGKPTILPKQPKFPSLHLPTWVVGSWVIFRNLFRSVSAAS
jgi:hypothetical protein